MNFIKQNTTYFSDFINSDSVKNSLINTNSAINLLGYFDQAWSTYDTFNKCYGISKKTYNKGALISYNASDLFYIFFIISDLTQ